MEFSSKCSCYQAFDCIQIDLALNTFLSSVFHLLTKQIIIDYMDYSQQLNAHCLQVNSAILLDKKQQKHNNLVTRETTAIIIQSEVLLKVRSKLTIFTWKDRVTYVGMLRFKRKKLGKTSSA